MIQYLYDTKEKTLKYEDENNKACLFICVNNVSFVNNTLNCKSFQSYIMMLFEDAIVWKISKQNIIIMSSIEAEFLVLFQIVKKAIFISQLLNIMILKLNESLVVECDNNQTFRLVKEKFIKLSTKLYHIDIHNHWFCQEYAEQQVLFKWISTKNMIADDLIKMLFLQQHEAFIKLIKIDNITEQIEIEKRMKMLRDKIKLNKTEQSAEMMFLIYKKIKTHEIHQNHHLV